MIHIAMGVKSVTRLLTTFRRIRWIHKKAVFGRSHSNPIKHKPTLSQKISLSENSAMAFNLLTSVLGYQLDSIPAPFSPILMSEASNVRTPPY